MPTDLPEKPERNWATGEDRTEPATFTTTPDQIAEQLADHLRRGRYGRALRDYALKLPLAWIPMLPFHPNKCDMRT